MARKRRRKRERGPDGPLTRWLLEKIRACGMSQAQLARSAGVSQSQISRFMTDDPDDWQSLNLETVDRLIPVLDDVYAQRLDAERDNIALTEAYAERLQKQVRAAVRSLQEFLEVREAAAKVSDFLNRVHDEHVVSQQ
jgi:transcriptional regulator with XRE-family HTH domain